MNTLAGCASDVFGAGTWVAVGMTLTSPTTWRIVAWLTQMKMIVLVMLGQATRPQDSDVQTKAMALIQAAKRAMAQGDLEAALSLAHVAYERFDLAKDNAGASQALVACGDVLSRLGELDAARDAYSQSLTGLKTGEARAQALSLLADVYAAQNKYTQAGEHYQQALSLYRRLGLRQREAQMTHRLAYALYEQARWAEAETLYRQALELADALNLRSVKASLLLEIGNSLAQQGQMAEARRWFERSVAHARSSRDQATLADALHSLATVCALDGETERAKILLATVLDLRDASGDMVAVTDTRYDLALADSAVGRPTATWSAGMVRAT